MEMLKLEEIEFPNENGKLIGIKETIVIKDVKKQIKLYPFTSEEFEEALKQINANKDDDGTFVNTTLISKIIEPVITKENIRFVKPILKAKLLKAILKATGIDEAEIKETTSKPDDKTNKSTKWVE